MTLLPAMTENRNGIRAVAPHAGGATIICKYTFPRGQQRSAGLSEVASLGFTRQTQRWFAAAGLLAGGITTRNGKTKKITQPH